MACIVLLASEMGENLYAVCGHEDKGPISATGTSTYVIRDVQHIQPWIRQVLSASLILWHGHDLGQSLSLT